MRRVALFAAAGAVALFATAVPSRAADYAVRVEMVNRVGLQLSNYGFLGNNFISRSASFEYPLGAGYEHLSRGGLWVGAHALDDDGAFTGVSAAIVDNSQGSSGPSETEFTPLEGRFTERSRIQNAKRYSPDAISDQDLIAFYADTPAKPSYGFQREPHRPMHLRITQRGLGFTLPAANSFVVTSFTIHNDGPPLADVWVGLYAQLASGNREAYSVWPPSAANGPGSWYYRAYSEYDSSRTMVAERFCQALPLFDGCRVQLCPPWVGLKYLRSVAPGGEPAHVVHRWWMWAPGDTTRDEDLERYRLMSGGGPPNPPECPLDGSCSPIQLLSVGPFPRIEAGDSVTVDFAFVGGDDRAKLSNNADYAAFAASINYHLPSPPPSPRVHVVPGDRSVDLWWDDSPEFATDPTSPAPGGRDFEGYRIYLGEDRAAPLLLAQYDLPDTTGFDTGLSRVLAPQPLVVDGVTYRYRQTVNHLRNGFRYFGAITSYDIGDVGTPPLESGLEQNKFALVTNAGAGAAGGVTVYPNPYRVDAAWDAGAGSRRHYVWFAGLPARATIRIYSLSGDLIYERDFDGGTYHGESAPGLYDPARDVDITPMKQSGGAFAWDLVSRRGQAVATGLYVWSVEDRASGAVSRGKLLLVKSDRE
ncbi:MAG: hypothetical protein U0704_07875 [Candidatus Eisenbacteria bacterium]